MIQERDLHGADLRGVLRALRHRWKLAAVLFVTLVSAAVGFTMAEEKRYSATASLLFRDPGLDQKLFGTTFVSPRMDPDREAATNLRLVSLDAVARRTAEAIGGLTTEEVSSRIQTQSEGQSDVVSVTATHPSPVLAQRLANTFARQYILFRIGADRSKIAEAESLVQNRLRELPPEARMGAEGRSLKARADQLQVLASLQTGNAELVQTAQLPTSPSSPKVKRNIALAIMLGLFVGPGFALLLERLDRRIREPDELEEALGRPILGMVPHTTALAAKRFGLAPGEVSLPPAETEAFRMLQARLRYFNVDREVRTVLVSSASAADGKTTVAVHLAAAAVGSGSRVLLLEADLRRPTLTNRLGGGQRVGLTEVLTHSAALETALRHVPVGVAHDAETHRRGFDLMSAGFLPPNPSELLESQRMQELLERLALEYDLVIIDTPPLLVVSDAIPLIKQVDGVVIVSRLGSLTRDSARQLRAQLDGLDAPVLGVVANGVPGWATAAYYSYGYELLPSSNGAGSNAKALAAYRPKAARTRK